MNYNTYETLDNKNKNLANYFIYSIENALLSQLDRDKLLELFNKNNILNIQNINNLNNYEIRRKILRKTTKKYTEDDNIRTIDAIASKMAYILKNTTSNIYTLEYNKLNAIQKLVFNNTDKLIQKTPGITKGIDKRLSELAQEYINYATEKDVLTDNALTYNIVVEEYMNNIANNVNKTKKRSK